MNDSSKSFNCVQVLDSKGNISESVSSCSEQDIWYDATIYTRNGAELPFFFDNDDVTDFLKLLSSGKSVLYLISVSVFKGNREKVILPTRQNDLLHI